MSGRSERSQPPPATARRRWPIRRRASAGEPAGSSTRLGTVADEQVRSISTALPGLAELDVREVMTPRVDVVALTIPVAADDVARAVRESGHRCFPVVNHDLDDLVGVFFVNDLFRTGRRSANGTPVGPSPLDISRRVRQPYVLPETLGVLDALADMRRRRHTFAVVVDEYGGVAGVLTVKDLLEPLVGDLHDEFDSDEEPAVVRVDANRWLVDGRASVDEVRDRLRIAIPDGDYVTFGGFLFDAFGHIPDEGEILAVDDWELRVAEMDKRRIATVVARHEPPAPDEEPATHDEAPGTSERPGAAAVAGHVGERRRDLG